MEVLSMAKKIFSVILALALVFSLSPGVFAATGDPTGSSTATGEGDTTYLDTEVYSVLLPTSANLDFTLDPLGLLDVAPGESKDLSALPSGKIISDTIVGVLNKSSVDIELTIGLKITGDATVVAAEADADDDTDNNVFMAVRPSKIVIDDSMIGTLSKPGATLASGAAGAFPLNDTGYVLNFLLGKAAYVVTNTDGERTYDYKTGVANGVGTAITFEGAVNPTADWSAYAAGTKSVGLAAVFSFEKADKTAHAYLAQADLQDSTPADIVGLKQKTASAVTIPEPTYGFKTSAGLSAINNSGNISDPIGGANPLAGTATFTIDAATLAANPTDVSFNFAFDGAEVSDIWWSDGAGAFAASLAAFDIDELGGTVTFGSMWGTAAPGINYEYINLDNNDSFLLKIVLE
jgi:hypothetical protein